jgi:hypothetical protein
MLYNRVAYLKIRLTGERRLDRLAIPVTLIAAFGGLDMGVTVKLCITVFMTGNRVMQQLLWRDAECKEHQQEAGSQSLYGFLAKQFLLQCCKLQPPGKMSK